MNKSLVPGIGDFGIDITIQNRQMDVLCKHGHAKEEEVKKGTTQNKTEMIQDRFTLKCKIAISY